jgi:hypothetical protein
MLCIDISVNRKIFIGEIFIQRLTQRVPKTGNCTYIITEPKGFSKIKIKHNYNDGWLPLLEKAIIILKENGFSTERKKNEIHRPINYEDL